MVWKRALVSLMASGMLALTVGCDVAGEPEKRTIAGADPLTEVRAAAVKTASMPAHVTMSVPRVEVSGDADPSGRALALTISTELDGETSKQEVRVVGDDAYFTLGKTYLPGIDPTKYIQFAASAFASVSVVHLADPFDPAGVKGLAPAIVDAQRTANGAYAGKLDLTRAPAGTSRGLLPATAEQLQNAGDAIKDIPYEAALDGQGRLTSMIVKMPAYGSVPAYTSTVTFSAFEKPVHVARPSAAETTDVSDGIRRLLTK
jgi:hypothetical protein